MFRLFFLASYLFLFSPVLIGYLFDPFFLVVYSHPLYSPLQSDRSRGFSLWRNGSTPELPNALLKESAVLPLTLGRSLSANHPLGVDPTDQHNSLKLFGQLLGPAAKRGEGALREDLEQQRGEGQRKTM
jgi:hypothetical protein